MFFNYLNVLIENKKVNWTKQRIPSTVSVIAKVDEKKNKYLQTVLV